MRRGLFVLGVGLFFIAQVSLVRADVNADFKRSGRYQMFISPQGNRVYVLDSQSGRMFQLVNYKEIGKEILEEVPYVYGSNRLCTPSEYENSSERCFNKNYEYIKTLLDLKREHRESQTPPAPSPKPE